MTWMLMSWLDQNIYQGRSTNHSTPICQWHLHLGIFCLQLPDCHSSYPHWLLYLCSQRHQPINVWHSQWVFHQCYHLTSVLTCMITGSPNSFTHILYIVKPFPSSPNNNNSGIGLSNWQSYPLLHLKGQPWLLKQRKCLVLGLSCWFPKNIYSAWLTIDQPIPRTWWKGWHQTQSRVVSFHPC